MCCSFNNIRENVCKHQTMQTEDLANGLEFPTLTSFLERTAVHTPPKKVVYRFLSQAQRTCDPELHNHFRKALLHIVASNTAQNSMNSNSHFFFIFK